MLEKVANEIYGEIRPEDVLFKDKVFTIKNDVDGYIFSINMPFVDKNELNLSQNGDEITISIKNERRSIIVPTKLQTKEITSAKYDDGKLNIYFA